LRLGLAIVLAEDIKAIGKTDPPSDWDQLCPEYETFLPEITT